MKYLIEIFASLAECYITARFCSRFLEYRSDKFSMLKTAALFVLLSAENIFFTFKSGYDGLFAALMIIVIFVHTILFMGGKLYEKILASIIPAIITLPVNMIIIYSFIVFTGCSYADLMVAGSDLRTTALFLTKFGFFFACEALVRARRKNEYAGSGSQWIIQLSCFAVSAVISILLWSISKTADVADGQFLIVYIMIALLNILLFVLLRKMERESAVREENRILQVSLAAQEQLVTEAREGYTEMRTLRHDMKHCLSTAAELIGQGKNAEAKEYIEKALDEKLNTAAMNVNTGSAVIDAAINSKLALCAKNNIRAKCLVDAEFGSISEIDLSILISNMLENAVRGCAGADVPEIEFVINSKKSFLYIMARNSIPASVLSENPDLHTNKDDKSAHGFGIKSMKNLAEKYGGSAEFKEENGYFIVEIWLSDIK